MSAASAPPAPSARAWRRPLTARASDEEHRAATPLELFFDLCFVVAIAQAAAHLHHAIAEGHAATGVVSYLTVFFAIWWAWMNFTWFASAYDNDDVPYRVATLVQMTGVLVIAAGVPRGFDARDFGIVFLGYAIMRAALVAQWLRAAFAHPAGRTTAVRYATGLTACMAGWSVLLLEGSWPLWGWWTMALAELAVPIWAERAAQTAWHPHHIAERFGLFTIIVLGESVLAATVAVQTAVDDQQGSTGLYAAVIGGLLTMFSMWWLYFAKPAHRLLVSDRTAFPWGYGHYVIFASAAAVGAGLAVSVDHVTHHTELTDSSAGAAVTVPVVLFLLTLWALHLRPHHTGRVHAALPPITAALILASTMTPQPVLITGLLMTALVVISLITVLKAPRLRHG